MELRTPAPLSDDDVYRFAGTSAPTVALSAHPANSKSPDDGDAARAVASVGDTPKTIISDPVVVCLTGSGPAVSAEREALPADRPSRQQQ